MSDIPVSDGFDFAVGKPPVVEAQGYANKQGFLAVGHRPKPHLGEDWNRGGGNDDLGDPVYAVSKGKVVWAKDGGRGWGPVIIVRHQLPDGKQVESLYGHMQDVLVSEGATVERGQKIGTIGNVGGMYWAHLHFEIRASNCPKWGLPGPGYRTDTTGWLHPTQFIQAHRNLLHLTAQYHSQKPYPTVQAGGAPVEWWIKFKNTSDKTWENHNGNNHIIKLGLGGYGDPHLDKGGEFNSQWPSPDRLAILHETSVSKGKVGSFRFSIQAPASMKGGVYRIQMTPKMPQGWLRKPDGQPHNCFVTVTVIEKKYSSFSNAPVGQVKQQCPAKLAPAPLMTPALPSQLAELKKKNESPKKQENAPAKNADLDEKEILEFYCDHKIDGNTRKSTGSEVFEVVQNVKAPNKDKDIITLIYKEKGSPPPATIEVNGKKISKSGSDRGGGVYKFDVSYTGTRPGNNPFARGGLPLSFAPTLYTAKSQGKTLAEVRAHYPDKWELSLFFPALSSVKTGARLGQKSIEEVVGPVYLKGKAVDAGSYVSAARWSPLDNSMTRKAASATHGESRTTMVTPNSITHRRGVSQSRTRGVARGKKSHDAIVLKRNDGDVSLDILNILGSFLQTAKDIFHIIDVIQDTVPKVGWYSEVDVQLMQGTCFVFFGNQEHQDHRVFLGMGLGIDLTILQLGIEFGFGVDAAIKAQIYARFEGSLKLKISGQRAAPEAKGEINIPLETTFSAAMGARVEAGKFVKLHGECKSAITTTTTFKIDADGLQITGENKFTGVTATVTFSVGEGGKYGQKTLWDAEFVPPKSLGRFHWPENKQYRFDDGLSRPEIQGIMEKMLTEGTNIRVYEERDLGVHRGVWKTHTIAMALTTEVLKRKDIKHDRKTLEGVAYAFRQELEKLPSDWWDDGLNYITSSTFNNFVGGSVVQTILDRVKDPIREAQHQL